MPVDIRNASAVRDAALITFVIGLIFVAVGAESLAAFNACVADPACLPGASAMNVGAFCAVLAIGIVLVVAGVWILVAERRVPRSATT
jgi:succinate dehydrogenase/fumarate reductase cytochrome b subunit